MTLAAYGILFAAFAFIFGAVVGSFLNVCIYRLPRDLSVNEPKRSFCPACDKPIPWHRNLPLVSWLALRGRCADCHQPIPVRYFAVELLTACLFLAIWLVFPPLVAGAYAVLASLLIVATFIDLEHYIIPDSITLGGVGAGVAASLLVPSLMGQTLFWKAGLWSLASAAAGYASLWAVVEGGKLVFGRKRITLDQEGPFVWTRHGDDADLDLAGEKIAWSEIFSRESDQLVIECDGIVIDGTRHATPSARFHYNRLVLPDREIELMQIDRIEGRTSAVVIPREAMGFGDVKFIAGIGAFLGWKAVFFTIFSASIIGAVVGGSALLLRKREWSAKIPFGPYLALGALVWMFFGPALLDWYLGILFPPGP